MDGGDFSRVRLMREMRRGEGMTSRGFSFPLKGKSWSWYTCCDSRVGCEGMHGRAVKGERKISLACLVLRRTRVSTRIIYVSPALLAFKRTKPDFIPPALRSLLHLLSCSFRQGGYVRCGWCSRAGYFRRENRCGLLLLSYATPLLHVAPPPYPSLALPLPLPIPCTRS